jgi:hypothetical protein
MKIQTFSFSKNDLEKVLSLLNEQLQKNGVIGEVCIVDGAAMMLAFASPGAAIRNYLLLSSPGPFRSRNLFIDEDSLIVV